MRKILKWMILIAIIGVISYTAYSFYKETKIKRGESNALNIIAIEPNTNNGITNNQVQETKKNLKLVEETYKGYPVAAHLKIEKLGIDTSVLENYTNEAMNICVTKFFGPEPNEVGNFCITGHNYITKNMFGYLYLLKVGDTFLLTDNTNGEVKYKIYEQYRAKPTQTYRFITKNKRKTRGYPSYLL